MNKQILAIENPNCMVPDNLKSSNSNHISMIFETKIGIFIYGKIKRKDDLSTTYLLAR